MEKLGIPMPDSGFASSFAEAVKVAGKIGYPVLVRPSYVLGGRGMEIVFDETALEHYINAAAEISPERPVLIDKFLKDAVEAEADALSDGKEAFVPSIMQHIEFAGIHSGDSACVIPPVDIPQKHIETITDYTKRIALELGVVGLINIQFAISEDRVYILEANPRASRTVPLVSKVCGFSMARSATELAMGKTLKELDIKIKDISHFGVKEAVFPFNMFPEVDPLLGPEMRSTGEVLGIAPSFPLAFFKAQEATQQMLPTQGCVLITIAKKDRYKILETAQQYRDLGFEILATVGTAGFLKENGIEARTVRKIHEGRPNIVDHIANGEIRMLINTPHGIVSEHDDSEIRKAAIRHKVPYITTIEAAAAAASGIKAFRQGGCEVKSIQEYHRLTDFS
jgi:carbamoyl-phosphate synthase large subunit